LLKDKADTLVVRSPEKAGVGGSTPSLATIIPKHLDYPEGICWAGGAGGSVIREFLSALMRFLTIMARNQ
jgi:hypothetical protein